MRLVSFPTSTGRSVHLNPACIGKVERHADIYYPTGVSTSATHGAWVEVHYSVGSVKERIVVDQHFTGPDRDKKAAGVEQIVVDAINEAGRNL